MSFTVVFEPEADLEIVEAFQWYEVQSFGLGGDFFRAVKQSEAILSRNPHQYRLKTFYSLLDFIFAAGIEQH